jgi:hypothetical protein
MGDEETLVADESGQNYVEAAELEKPEPQSDFTESEWALINQRRSQEDANRLFDLIAAGGSVNIVPDPEPREEEAAEEEEAA